MAVPRANLAVTKDGETYNKLQRPDDLFDKTAYTNEANERKRGRVAIDRAITGPPSRNKRAKLHYADSTANSLPFPDERHQHRSAAPIAECGMRFTLPIDDEETQQSDDSLGEALAYLRSVRSEASAIPNLLIAPTMRSKDAETSILQPSKAYTNQRAFYQDGAWISVDQGYEVAYDEEYELDDTDPQELYYERLIKRFETLRNMLGHGSHGLAQPDRDSSYLASTKPPSNRHEWLYTIDREFPIPAQVCQLDEKSVRRGLEYCAYAMDRFNTISKQKSCWVWTLLALSGDVGTLDSQGISHIRDLANKAAEMSNTLHAYSGQQREETKHHLLREELADDGQDGGSKARKSVSCGPSGESYISEMGYVRPDADEDVDLTLGISPTKAVPETQNDVQPQSDVPTDTYNRTNTDTNDNALEEARARLLAQLGDNLVQAGIPAPTLSIDETHSRHSRTLDQDSDVLQHEIKIRAMPSRAEAERQRQAIRMRDSATASLRGSDPPCAEPPVTVHSVAEDTVSCTVDLNTRVTIDMILTVAAECYGQRDLLEFRKPW